MTVEAISPFKRKTYTGVKNMQRNLILNMLMNEW